MCGAAHTCACLCDAVWFLSISLIHASVVFPSLHSHLKEVGGAGIQMLLQDFQAFEEELEGELGSIVFPQLTGFGPPGWVYMLVPAVDREWEATGFTVLCY